MALKSKFLLYSALVAVGILTSHQIYGAEDTTTPSTSKKSSSIQLKSTADDTLEAVLGSGNNILLKMGVNIKGVHGVTSEGQVDVPARLFLTDFTSSPTSDPDVSFSVKVDCDSTPLMVTLPEKPASFQSEDQFKEWLNQAYFTNQLKITYDFTVDVEKTAPSLAEHLFALPPGGYRFIGTHGIDNQQITPDDCTLTISYLSQRGKVNKTTVTLGGTLCLNKVVYAVEDHQQVFCHSIIDQEVFKTDNTKNFYQHRWVARSEVIAETTYQELPENLSKHWPQAPSGTYSLLQQKPADLREIQHISCWNGTTGDEVDISDGRVFSLICEAVTRTPEFTKSIVADHIGNLYAVHYKENIPPIAYGHEDIYQRFLNGRLIYKPNKDNDIGKIEFRIGDLANPLEGTFDLSWCGNTGNYLSISTGYRKGKKAENANKVEIWFTPRFLVEKEIHGSARHFQAIYPKSWSTAAPVGMFWTWGEWMGDEYYMDYLVTENMDNLSKIDLYGNWNKSKGLADCYDGRKALSSTAPSAAVARASAFIFIL